jgi:hypothetical protein
MNCAKALNMDPYLVEIKILKFRFIQLKLQVVIRKIKNIKTGYAAASYWSAVLL